MKQSKWLNGDLKPEQKKNHQQDYDTPNTDIDSQRPSEIESAGIRHLVWGPHRPVIKREP